MMKEQPSARIKVLEDELGRNSDLLLDRKEDEEMLIRCKIGDSKAILTALACTIAVAREPLTVPKLVDLLHRPTLLENGEKGTEFDEISAVSVTPDGKIVVSGSYGSEPNSTLCVWDVATEKCLQIRTFKGTLQKINVTPDGKLAITAWGGALRMWDFLSGEFRQNFFSHSGITAVSATPDVKMFISGSYGTSFCKLLPNIFGPSQELADEIESSNLFPEDEDPVPDNDTLQVRNFGEGKFLRTLGGHSEPVHAVAVTADVKFAVSEGDTLRFWDIATGACLATISFDATIVSCSGTKTHVIVGDPAGNVHFLRIHNFPNRPGLIR